MSEPDRTREPTRDELLAMAYVDGELADEARVEFERRLAAERPLRREVAELQALDVLARTQAPPEPMDHEWRELDRETLHGGGLRLGILLAALGLLGLGGWLVVQVFRSDMATVPKLFAAAALAGTVLVFLLTLRARLRTLPFDPYTKVNR